MLFFKQAFNFKLIEKKNNFKRLLRIPHSESIFCRKKWSQKRMLYMSPSKFYLVLFSGLVKEIVLCQLRDE